MNRAIKYRLYPTEEQKVFFIKTFGCCRKVYNLMLSDKINGYKENGKFPSVTPAMYKKEYPFLKETDSLALANVQINLQNAFAARFDKKRKTQNGFPKFKSAKRSRRSYTTNNQNGTIRIDDNKIRLPKVGFVKFRLHRTPEDSWVIKSTTISQDKDGKFYISVLFEFDREITAVPKSDNAIGLDYKSDGLYMDDQGNIGSDHKYFRKSHKKLAKEQRRLSRMIESNICGYRKGPKGGRIPIFKKPIDECKNIQKQKRKIAKIHKHIACQRLDHLHKLSTEIANQYDVVCVENLNMKAMANKGFGNGKATMDNGYGIFLTFLKYKITDRGKYYIEVDKWYASSQLCCDCGRIHPEMKDLSIRKMDCECGNRKDRDLNSAINIKREGLRILFDAA